MLKSHFIAKYFRPFIDAIHGPYKDNLRYWFGLRLIVMSLVYIVIAVLQGSNMTLQLVLSLIIYLGLSITLAEVVLLPFKSKILNILDLWFMVLLLFNIHMNLSYSSSETTISLTTTITIVFSFVTFLSSFCLYRSYLSISHPHCIRKCVQYLFIYGKCKTIKKIF